MMRRRTCTPFLVTVLLASLWVAPSAWAAPTGTNLLTNPGFETGDFAGWSVSGNAVAGVAPAGTVINGSFWGPAPVQPRTGNYAAYNLASAENGAGRIGTIITQTVPVTPGATYLLGFYMRSSGVNAGFSPAISANGNALRVEVKFTGQYTSYYEVAAVYTAGPADTAAVVSFSLSGSGSERALLNYDDFYFAQEEPTYSVTPLFDGTRPVKAGAVVPIKLRITDHSGNNVSSAELLVHATGIRQVSTLADGPLQDAGNANADNNFRYDAQLAGYIFNYKTATYMQGTYEMYFTVGGEEATTYKVGFEVK